MYRIEKTAEFDKWLRKLKDLRAKAIILFRIQKMESDEHFGDCEPVGNGIWELKVDYAKGYRVYYKNRTEKSLFYSLVEISHRSREILRRQKMF